MNRFVSFALCVAAVGSISAQKATVDQANKLSGKPDQLKNARELIQQAMNNDETKNDARTYYTAGKIEFDAFDKATTARMINPDDPTAKPVVMADELLNGYKYFLKALPLDSVPDAKGQVKPKYSKDMLGKIVGHANDFFTAGADYFGEKMYYPQAYEAFVIYAGLPASGMMGKNTSIIPAEQIPTAYFNAGLAGYSGDQLEAAAEAFKNARLAGYDKDEAYIYEIACWQNIVQRDESRNAEAQAHILDAAKAGNEKFGLEQPIFINNIINSMVMENKYDDAIAELNTVIAANPDNAGLIGLRGFVYDRAEKDDLSEADYRKAAEMPNVDFETLVNAGKKIFRIGQVKYNEIEVGTPETKAAREKVKNDYFLVSKKYADKARAMNPDSSDLQSLDENIDYALETFFN